jgi:hypothetical protein
LEDGIYLKLKIPSRPPTNRSVSPAPKTVYITYWERERTCLKDVMDEVITKVLGSFSDSNMDFYIDDVST